MECLDLSQWTAKSFVPEQDFDPGARRPTSLGQVGRDPTVEPGVVSVLVTQTS